MALKMPDCEGSIVFRMEQIFPTIAWIMRKQFDLWKELKSSALKNDRSETIDDKYIKVIGRYVSSVLKQPAMMTQMNIPTFIQMERLMRKDSCRYEHN